MKNQPYEPAGSENIEENRPYKRLYLRESWSVKKDGQRRL